MNARTALEIVTEVQSARGSYSFMSFHRHKKELGICALGARQRPQLYAPDTANRILTHLGINGVTAPPMPKAKAVRRDTRTALVTLPKLRRERAAANKRKATR